MDEEQRNSNEPTSSFNPSIQPPPNSTPPSQPQIPSSEPTADLRTMESDAKHVEKGEEPSPQPFRPETPPFSASEEPIFKPIEPILPEEPKIAPPLPLKKEGRKSPGKLLPVVIAIAVAAAAGTAGYFLVWPILASRFFNPPVVETPPEETPPAKEETASTPSVYASLFTKSADSQENIILDETNLQSLRTKLNAAAQTNAAQKMKEVIFKDSEEELMNFPNFLPIILPEFVSENLATYFEDSFTAFIYTDENGSWPGYIAQAKTTADILLQAKSTISEMENSNNLKNFFLADTSSTQGFKSGQTGTPSVSTRYLVFEKTGAALNYGWLDGKLIITASYPAFQKALEYLR